MPESVNLSGEDHDDLAKRCGPLDESEQNKVEGFGADPARDDVVQGDVKRRLIEAIKNLALDEARVARRLAIALHSEGEPIRLGDSGQPAL